MGHGGVDQLNSAVKYLSKHDTSLGKNRSEVFRKDNTDGPVKAGEQLRKSSQYGIRRNYYIAALMPIWSRQHLMANFSVIDKQKGHVTLKRLDAGVNEVPLNVEEAAGYFALKDIVRWNYGCAARFGRAAFICLMARRFSDFEGFIETLPTQRARGWLYRRFHRHWLQRRLY